MKAREPDRRTIRGWKWLVFGLANGCGPVVDGLVPRSWRRVIVAETGDAQVIDARPREVWLAGHIPGAVHLHWTDVTANDDRGSRGPLPLPELAMVLEDRGVVSDAPVVVVGSGPLGDGDDGNVYWALRYMGHPDVRVLDGGLLGWVSQGGEPVDGEETAPMTEWDNVLDQPVLADSVHVAEWDGVVLDVRSQAEYDRGHIPGAAWLEWTEVFDGERMSTETEVRALFSALGIASDTAVVTTCRSGIRAGHTFMVLDALGQPDAANYVGSWRRWTAEGRPVER